jgi:hypothetical protein
MLLMMDMGSHGLRNTAFVEEVNGLVAVMAKGFEAEALIASIVGCLLLPAET